MTHCDFDEFDQKVCAVTFKDGSSQSGLLYVFDLTGGYRNILLYHKNVNGNDDCLSFNPEEVASVACQ